MDLPHAARPRRLQTAQYHAAMTRARTRQDLASEARPDPIQLPVTGVALAYASELLASLGVPVSQLATPGDQVDLSPAMRWAQSGAMMLTGAPDGPPLLAPGPVAACADGAAAALAALSPCRPSATGRSGFRLDGAALLGERAATADSPARRRGRWSVGGSCRLLRCRDGFLALNLARDDDIALLPAWLESPQRGEPWDFAERTVADRARAELVRRARLIGLPVAPVPDRAPPPQPWCRIATRGRAVPRAARPPLVVDLSSLWAGPLCGQLLAAAGAHVVKVESHARPDGARRGPTAFFDLMNGEKRSVALDLATRAADGPGLQRLQSLIERADIVIESSRPRALQQLGIDANELVLQTPGLTWIGITGYGRSEPEANWVAFGDDAAVAAGLIASAPDGTPLFCGDAIADPLTGLHAAVAALASWRAGGGVLLDIALRDVAASATWFSAPATDNPNEDSRREPVAAPRARQAARRAPALGADTAAVLRELGIPC